VEAVELQPGAADAARRPPVEGHAAGGAGDDPLERDAGPFVAAARCATDAHRGHGAVFEEFDPRERPASCAKAGGDAGGLTEPTTPCDGEHDEVPPSSGPDGRSGEKGRRTLSNGAAQGGGWVEEVGMTDLRKRPAPANSGRGGTRPVRARQAPRKHVPKS